MDRIQDYVLVQATVNNELVTFEPLMPLKWYARSKDDWAVSAIFRVKLKGNMKWHENIFLKQKKRKWKMDWENRFWNNVQINKTYNKC